MHTNQACNLLCYEVISNCIPCLKVKTCCLVFYHALTLYELDVHWMKSFFVSLSAQHRVSGLKLRIKEPNLKTVLIKSMLFMNEVRWKQVFCSLSSNVYHQKTLSKYLLLEKTAIFWCIFLFDRKIKVRLKDQAAEEEEEVGHNKEWGKERKKEMRMRGVANSIIWNWNLLPNYSSGTTSLTLRHAASSLFIPGIFFNWSYSKVWPGLKKHQVRGRQ